MTNKKKKAARDIQQRTGWKYSFCKYVVDALGYESVSDAVDEAESLEELGVELNRMAGAK